MGNPKSMVVSGSLIRWYILPIGGLYITYHLLREPETAVDARWAPTMVGFIGWFPSFTIFFIVRFYHLPKGVSPF